MVILKYKGIFAGMIPEQDWDDYESVVYVLRCPFTGIIRYIGNTCDPFTRFRVHAYASQRPTRQWALQLQQQQAMFRMDVVTLPLPMPVAYRVEALLINRTRAAYPGQLLNHERQKRGRPLKSPPR